MRVIINKEAPSELALTIINEGSTYRARCDLARLAAADLSAGIQRHIAQEWLHRTAEAARKYDAQFRPGEPGYMAREILAAALEIADYYAQHITEMED